MRNQGVTLWLPAWRRNGFYTNTGARVSNLPLILFLDSLLEARPEGTTRFVHVEAHSGIAGNEAAEANRKLRIRGWVTARLQLVDAPLGLSGRKGGNLVIDFD